MTTPTSKLTIGQTININGETVKVDAIASSQGGNMVYFRSIETEEYLWVFEHEVNS
jgi:hypothetical protein